MLDEGDASEVWEGEDLREMRVRVQEEEDFARQVDLSFVIVESQELTFRRSDVTVAHDFGRRKQVAVRIRIRTGRYGRRARRWSSHQMDLIAVQRRHGPSN